MGNKLIVRRQIVLIIISVMLIATILVLLSYNFFMEYDMKDNISIKLNTEYKKLNDIKTQSERTYHIIYDEGDEMNAQIKNGVESVLKSIKVNYTVSNIDSIRVISEQDYIILAADNWYDNKDAIDSILDSVTNGASLIIAGIPNEDPLFMSYARKFGIYEIGGKRVSKGLKITDDIILGMEKGDALNTIATDDYINDVHLIDKAKVYLTDESDVAIYYTIDFGKGEIGVYNGDNLFERYYGGVVVGVLGTLSDGIIYPIINSGVMFIDDWPGPFQGENDTLEKQYGMDIDDFLKLVWWPDMLSLNKKYGVIYTGQYVLTYNNIQKQPFDIGDDIFNIPMFSYGQQILKNDGELGLHGYNHQPLKFSEYVTDEYLGYYAPWDEKEDAVTALNYAVEELKTVFPNYSLACYVPPSNIIDEQGIEVVKEVLGTPMIMSALFIGDENMPSHDFTIDDGVIYFPRMTSGSFLDDEVKMDLACGMGQFGVVSHFIHPDDAFDIDRSRGMEWEQMRLEYDKMMEYITERYPYIEFQTISEAANKTVDWYNLDYRVNYTNEYVKVECSKLADKYEMILRTDKKIIEGDGYNFEPAGTNSYYVEIYEPEIMILLESED